MCADSQLYREQAGATQCLEALPSDTNLLETFTTIGVHGELLRQQHDKHASEPTLQTLCAQVLCAVCSAIQPVM